MRNLVAIVVGGVAVNALEEAGPGPTLARFGNLRTRSRGSAAFASRDGAAEGNLKQMGNELRRAIVARAWGKTQDILGLGATWQDVQVNEWYKRNQAYGQGFNYVSQSPACRWVDDSSAIGVTALSTEAGADCPEVIRQLDRRHDRQQLAVPQDEIAQLLQWADNIWSGQSAGGLNNLISSGGDLKKAQFGDFFSSSSGSFGSSSAGSSSAGASGSSSSSGPSSGGSSSMSSSGSSSSGASSSGSSSSSAGSSSGSSSASSSGAGSSSGSSSSVCSQFFRVSAPLNAPKFVNSYGFKWSENNGNVLATGNDFFFELTLDYSCTSVEGNNFREERFNENFYVHGYKGEEGMQVTTNLMAVMGQMKSCGYGTAPSE